MEKPPVVERLSPRQGKVLRHVVKTAVQPVSVESCIHTMPWSDLPKTDLQARKALDVLRRFGLVERVDKSMYVSTQEGRDVIAYANKEHLWQQAPPPSVTNRFLHTEPPKGKKKK